jgi:hypothetical protein
VLHGEEVATNLNYPQQTLVETIASWQKFKLDSLPSLEDPRINPEDRKISIANIDAAVRELEAKVSHIKKNIDEVKDLRTGVSRSSNSVQSAYLAYTK